MRDNLKEKENLLNFIPYFFLFSLNLNSWEILDAICQRMAVDVCIGPFADIFNLNFRTFSNHGVWSLGYEHKVRLQSCHLLSG